MLHLNGYSIDAENGIVYNNEGKPVHGWYKSGRGRYITIGKENYSVARLMAYAVYGISALDRENKIVVKGDIEHPNKYNTILITKEQIKEEKTQAEQIRAKIDQQKQIELEAKRQDRAQKTQHPIYGNLGKTPEKRVEMQIAVPYADMFFNDHKKFLVEVRPHYILALESIWHNKRGTLLHRIFNLICTRMPELWKLYQIGYKHTNDDSSKMKMKIMFYPFSWYTGKAFENITIKGPNSPSWDHIRPTSMGGDDSIGNIVPILWSENLSKRDGYYRWWMASKNLNIDEFEYRLADWEIYTII